MVKKWLQSAVNCRQDVAGYLPIRNMAPVLTAELVADIQVLTAEAK